MQKEEKFKDKVSRGILWGGLNTGLQQLLNLVIGIFLARLLTPDDYGMVGLLAVFSGLAGVLQEGGFISALTNKKNVGQEDYNSVFWFSLTCSVTFYVILFFLAPVIARFYNIPELTPLARFIFIGFIFSAMNVVPRTLLFKNLRVKEVAVTTILSLSISGIIAIILSYYGATYWGLAVQTVSYTFLFTFITWINVKWRPSFKFSIRPIKELLGFGSKLVVTNVFNTLNNNVFSVLLGKFYSAYDVGQFNQANKWNGMGYSLVSGIVFNVAQPSLVKVVEDPERLTRVFRKLLRFMAFISFPLMFGLALVAPEFIVITIGEKWLFSSMILRLLCIWGAFYPISYLFSNLLLSQGRSLSYMWITISLSVFQILAVYFSYPYGLYTMIYVFISLNIIWVLVWYFYAKKGLQMTLYKLIKDIMPFSLLAVAGYIIAALITYNIENIYLIFIIKIGVMASVYLGVLWIFKSPMLMESINYLSKRGNGE